MASRRSSSQKRLAARRMTDIMWSSTLKAGKSDDRLQKAAAIDAGSWWLQPYQLKLMLDGLDKVVWQLAAKQLRERKMAAA